MDKKKENVGNRWFKCDFHLHTIASKCFADKEVTAKQWVDRAIEQGLDCVAISDHNNNAGIDAIIEAALGTRLSVFPGVEITCDTAKIHLLVLFDLENPSSIVGDFLIKADVDRKDFGDQLASTKHTIFQIADLAKACGALLIPAHIDDDYNSLIKVSDAHLKEFFDRDDVNAVQILSEAPTTKGPVKCARYANLSLLTFSDNPDAEGKPEHGLWGIGKSFTWIKMGAKPSLEGLRQAFLLPETRVRNKFQTEKCPYKSPRFWIRSLCVSNSLLNQQSPISVDFSPQLTSIIGSRGSGKSSILRLIRGALNKTDELTGLKSIYDDQKDFYQIPRKNGRGVFKDGSQVMIEFYKGDDLYRLKATEIKDTDTQNMNLEQFENGKWCAAGCELIDQLQVEQYSQKQIYDLAQEPAALRQKIDRAIPEVSKLDTEREGIYNRYLSIGEEIRTLNKRIGERANVEHRLREVQNQIDSLTASGISVLQKSKHRFEKQQDSVDMFAQKINENWKQLERTDAFGFPMEFEKDIDNYGPDFGVIYHELKNSICDYENRQKELVAQYRVVVDTFLNKIEKTKWTEDKNLIIAKYKKKKAELEEKGIQELDALEGFENDKRKYETEIRNITDIEKEKEKKSEEKKSLRHQYLKLSKDITNVRQAFIDEKIKDEKLLIEVRPFRDEKSFIEKLRKIIEKPDRWENDIESLCNLVFKGSVEKQLGIFRMNFREIREHKDSTKLTQKFQNLVRELSPRAMDKLEIFLPEDKIEIKYKREGEKKYKSLSNSSPGEKTTAILTFILSYGHAPLILDQPEDDLDNRLIYDLIVDRLKKTKESRQIIVVTHNANIPVNGDSEYVISMASKKGGLSVNHCGTIDEKPIKNEIRNVMEGGEKAFQMRARRYKHIEE